MNRFSILVVLVVSLLLVIPTLGVMMYSEKYQGYFLKALVGYSSYRYEKSLPFVTDEERLNLSTWHLVAGVGYEFRPHFMIECMGDTVA